jgi:hypothetical protein
LGFFRGRRVLRAIGLFFFFFFDFSGLFLFGNSLNPGNGTPAEFQLGVFINFDDNRGGAFLDAREYPVESADGNDFIPLFQGRQHLLGILLLFVLGTDNQKVKNSDNRRKGDKTGNETGRPPLCRAFSAPLGRRHEQRKHK